MTDDAASGEGATPDGEPIRDPEAFYDEYGHEEWERLERSLHGRLEWEGTVEYLEHHLPETGQVLDVGGAAGRYTVWLAQQGYEVTLVDVSDEQRAIARDKVSERGLDGRVSIEAGDVRDLPFDDDAFDATLCLGGPLSHVLDADEREAGAAELRRVTEPGRPVFVSVMGRLNFLQNLLIRQNYLDHFPHIAETGDYDPGFDADASFDFTRTHFFRVAELETLLETAGCRVERVVGLEGVASITVDGSIREEVLALEDATRDGIRSVVEGQREDRSVADFSAHILAVCTATELS